MILFFNFNETSFENLMSIIVLENLLKLISVKYKHMKVLTKNILEYIVHTYEIKLRSKNKYKPNI